MVSAKYVIVFIMVSDKTDSKQFFSILIKFDFKLTVETEYVIGTRRIVMGRFCRCFKRLCKYSWLSRPNSIITKNCEFYFKT